MSEILNNLVSIYPEIFTYNEDSNTYHFISFPSSICENDDGTAMTAEFYVADVGMGYEKTYIYADPTGFPDNLINDYHKVGKGQIFEQDILDAGYTRIEMFKEFSYKIREDLPETLSWFTDSDDPNADPRLQEFAADLMSQLKEAQKERENEPD